MNALPNVSFSQMRRILYAEKLLTAEYETARTALSQNPENFEACITAMRRLGEFLKTREIPGDIVEKLKESGFRIEHHIHYQDLERYHLNKIPVGTELAMMEEHLLWCQHCLDRMEATERFISLVRKGVLRGGFNLELETKKSSGCLTSDIEKRAKPGLAT